MCRWELGEGLSAELWLFMLLCEDAVSMLEVELCSCPRPVLLQASSLSAWKAALVMWGAVPQVLCERQCSGRGPHAVPLHSIAHLAWCLC